MAEVVESLRSGWITTGPKVAKFEAMFRERLHAPSAHRRQFRHRRTAPGRRGPGPETRRRGDRSLADVDGDGERGRAVRRAAGVRRRGRRDALPRPGRRRPPDHAADARDHAGPLRRAAGGPRRVARAGAEARPGHHRGRRARHRRVLQRRRDRRLGRPGGLQLPRHQERDDRRGRDDRLSRRRRTLGGPPAPAAAAGRRQRPRQASRPRADGIRHPRTRLEVQHDGPPGGHRHSPDGEGGPLHRAAARAGGAVRGTAGGRGRTPPARLRALSRPSTPGISTSCNSTSTRSTFRGRSSARG